MNWKSLILVLLLLSQTLGFLTPVSRRVADHGVPLWTVCDQNHSPNNDYDSGSPFCLVYDALLSDLTTETLSGVVVNAQANPAYDPAPASFIRVVGIPRTPSPGKAELVAAKSGESLLPGEGAVGVYNDLIAAGSKGENLTPHHIPSANHMAGQGVSSGQGISIMMEQPVPGVGGRHRATFTYGTSADVGMTSRDALAAGIRDARSIYMQDGLYSPYVRQQLQEVIRQNKTLYPSIFAK
jgi:hypothetical protein